MSDTMTDISEEELREWWSSFKDTKLDVVEIHLSIAALNAVGPSATPGLHKAWETALDKLDRQLENEQLRTS